MLIAQKIGMCIKKQREKSGITTSALAKALSIKTSDLNAIESGTSEVLFSQVLLICSFLQKPLTAFDIRSKAVGHPEDILRREEFFDRLCKIFKCNTQAELASALGYHQSDISSMKSGRYTPGEAKMAKIAEKSGLSLRIVKKAFEVTTSE